MKCTTATCFCVCMQKVFGQCSADFMKKGSTAGRVAPNGFCRITCGACSCQPSAPPSPTRTQTSTSISPPSCVCTDTPPDSSYTCAQQVCFTIKISCHNASWTCSLVLLMQPCHWQCTFLQQTESRATLLRHREACGRQGGTQTVHKLCTAVPWTHSLSESAIHCSQALLSALQCRKALDSAQLAS